MRKTKSFYGFTANCTPMQRGKKEEQLSKLFRNDGIIYRFADFAVFMMFEKGYKATTKTITHGYVNGYYGREWRELSKPKTEATTGVLLISDKALTSITKCKAKIKELCDTKNVSKLIDDAIARGYKSPLYEAVNT